MALPHPGLLIPSAFGCYKLYKAGRSLAPVFHILRNDPRPIGELDGYRGPVEIEGRAREGDDGTVTAPFTGTRCLAYSYEVEEEQRAADQKDTWETIDGGTSGVEFVAEDDTGSVVVDPDGADIRGETHTEYVSYDETLPEHLVECFPDTDAGEPQDEVLDLHLRHLDIGGDSGLLESGNYRFTENRLHADDTVYVYGQVTDGSSGEWGDGHVDARVTDGDETPVFVISDTDERGTAWRYVRGSAVEISAGLVLVAISAFLVVLSM